MRPIMTLRAEANREAAQNTVVEDADNSNRHCVYSTGDDSIGLMRSYGVEKSEAESR